MDGKEIIKDIKEEIKEEESFLLKLFQLEKVVNKYKYQIIIFFALLIVVFIGYQVKSYIDEQNLIKTNHAYNELLVNPNDKKALEILKNNPKLFNLYLLHNDAKSVDKLKKVASGNDIVANIAKYEIAALKGDRKSLEDYTMTINAIYKDLALLNVERLYLKENNHKKAEEIANQIKDTQIKKLADTLLHYGIIK
jgi:hypothetical protein